MDAVEVRGEVACKGTGNVSGKARWIASSDELNKLCRGDILVCDMTGPDWVPAFEYVGAVVAARGGRLCHAAIIAKQMGVTCIVGVKKANALDGRDVFIDTNTGLISVVAEGAAGRNEAWEKAKEAGRSVSVNSPRELWSRFSEEG